MAITIAGRYRLDPVPIGKGGMGEVWGPRTFGCAAAWRSSSSAFPTTNRIRS